jgi:hypothetical protein
MWAAGCSQRETCCFSSTRLLTANSRTGALTAGTLGPLIEAEAVKHGIGLVIIDPLVTPCRQSLVVERHLD